MKKLILTLLVGFPAICLAQNDTTQVEKYCDVVAYGTSFSTKVTVHVDFGQEIKDWRQERQLKNEDGKARKFNSLIDALNYLGNQQWKLVSTYTTQDSSFSATHFVMKKLVKKDN